MAPGETGSRIVRRYPGSGTCETIYETADGNVWRHDPCVPVDTSQQRTGWPSYGVMIGGRIYPK